MPLFKKHKLGDTTITDVAKLKRAANKSSEKAAKRKNASKNDDKEKEHK